MKYTDIDGFVKKNNLLQGCEPKAGIYAIMIDGYTVYVGMSKNVY
jgi:hypothetical protein